MIVVITGVVTVGGVEYLVQTEVNLPDTKEKDNVIRPGPAMGS